MDKPPAGETDPDLERVRSIARLAGLELAADEEDRLAHQLTRILEHIDRIGELDTSRVEPLIHAVDLTDITAADEIGRSLDPATALRGSPEDDGETFRVPPVLRDEA